MARGKDTFRRAPNPDPFFRLTPMTTNQIPDLSILCSSIYTFFYSGRLNYKQKKYIKMIGRLGYARRHSYSAQL